MERIEKMMGIQGSSKGIEMAQSYIERLGRLPANIQKISLQGELSDVDAKIKELMPKFGRLQALVQKGGVLGKILFGKQFTDVQTEVNKLAAYQKYLNNFLSTLNNPQQKTGPPGGGGVITKHITLPVMSKAGMMGGTKLETGFNVPGLGNMSGVIERDIELSKKLAQEGMMELGGILSYGLQDAIGGFADSIGQLLSGDLGLQGFFDNILRIVGNFIKMFGSALVAFGIGKIAFGNINPFAAIAAGGALIALGSYLSGMASKGPDFSGAGYPAQMYGGTSKYNLEDGDEIELVYTCDLGRDVGGGFVSGQ